MMKETNFWNFCECFLNKEGKKMAIEMNAKEFEWLEKEFYDFCKTVDVALQDSKNSKMKNDIWLTNEVIK